MVRVVTDVPLTADLVRERMRSRTPGARPRAGRAWALVVIGACVVGAGIALHKIGSESFDYDETYSLHFIHSSWAHLLTVDNGNQAGFLALLKLWHHITTTEGGVRLLSWAPFVATIPTTAALARRLFGTAVAVVATFLVATHPLLVAYAGDARGYSWAVFAFTAGTFALVRGVQDEAPVAFWVGIAVLGGAVYLQPVTGFGAVPLLAWLWWLPAQRVPASRSLAAATYAVIAAPFAAVAADAGTGQIQWANSYGSLSEGVLYQLPGGTRPSLLLALAAVAGGVWTLTRVVPSPRDVESWTIGIPVVIVVGTAAITACAAVRQSFFVPRFLLFLVVPLSILAATLVLWLPWRQILVVGFSLLVVYDASVALRRSGGTHRQPWREVDTAMTAEAHPGDGLVVIPTGAITPLDQYHARHPARPPLPAVPAVAWGDPKVVHPGAPLPSAKSAPRLPARVWVVSPANPKPAQTAYLRNVLAGRTRVSRRELGTEVLELWVAP